MNLRVSAFIKVSSFCFCLCQERPCIHCSLFQAALQSFLMIGFLIVSSGLILGTIFGLFFCFAQDKFHLIKLSSLNNTLINYYPIKIELQDILLIQIIVILLGMVTTYLITYNNRFYQV